MLEPGLAERLLSGYRMLLDEELNTASRNCLMAYLGLLTRWNQTYNLTGVRDPDDMISRHLLDSLSILPWLNADSLLDVGTGAGLPGVPLAIMRPNMQVTLLDSAGKKIRFLRHVKRELALANIHPLQQRLENHEPAQAPATVISRAFSSLAQFAAASRHLLDAKSKLLAMKGRYPEEEIADLPGWIQVDKTEKLSIPGLHEQRHLVIMSLKL